MTHSKHDYMKRIRMLGIASVLVASLSSVAAAQDVSTLTVSSQGGAKGYSPDITEVIMDDLPQATATEIAPLKQLLRPRDGRTDAQYAEMKNAAARLAASGNHGLSSNAGAAPLQGGAFITTTNQFKAQSEICCTPSDMAIAVGPTYVAQFVNTYIALYTKSGALKTGYPKSATTFFGLPAGTYTTDPRAFYDWTNGRYVIAMLTESSHSSNNVGQLMLAISKNGGPGGAWWIYKWQVGNTGECPDYPTLGHDTNNWGTNGTHGAIYIGINQFANNCNGGFIQNYMFVIPKDQPYAGTGFQFWYEYGFNAGGKLLDTLQPSNPVTQGDRPAATYLTSTFNISFACNPCNGLSMWSVNNVAAFTTGGPGPTFTGVTVPTAHNYYYPPQANQPSHATSIETLDTRISGSMYYHAGDLWGTFETGVSGVSGAHPIWFDYHPKLDVNGNITGGDERQEDCFICGGEGTNGSAYFSILSPDSENNVTMTYTFSDDTTYPEMAITGRRVSYGDMMNGAGFVAYGGSGYYRQGRWGDFAAVAPDNSNPNSPAMWVAGDFDNGGNWGTGIVSETYAKPTDQ
jgi:hypothetical protein